MMEVRLFYEKSASYWANVPATIDGVLGGYGHISDIDITGSKAFLENVFALENPPGTKRALDCGAGIGRVSKHLLIPRFDKVDLIEQDEKFINTAKQSIGIDNVKLGRLYQDPLQAFEFEEPNRYDVIWCQWVLSHLNDFDLMTFLNKCRCVLATDGVIIIKENVTVSNDLEIDDDDFSVTRPLDLMMQIFQAVQLKVVLTDIQEGFPDEIYPVHSFALLPLVQNIDKDK